MTGEKFDPNAPKQEVGHQKLLLYNDEKIKIIDFSILTILFFL